VTSDGAGGHHYTMTAILAAEAALQLSPSDPEILLFLSKQHWNTLQKEKALLRVEEAFAALPKEGRPDLAMQIRTWQSYLLFGQHDWEGADRVLKEALELVPGDQDALGLKCYYASARADREKQAASERKRTDARKRKQWIQVFLISAVGATITGGLCFLGNHDTEDLRQGRGWGLILTVVSVTFWILFGTLGFRTVLRRKT